MGLKDENDGLQTAPDLNGDRYYTSKFVRDVHIMAQVERIWFQYDQDQNGTLEFIEVMPFLEQVQRNVKYDHDELLGIFK